MTLLTVAGYLSSCNSETESISGNYTYQQVTSGEGEQVKDGEYIILDLKVIDNNDSVWFDRKADSNPMVVLKDSAKWADGTEGVYEIFYYAKKGDSLVVDLTVEDFFANTVKIAVPETALDIENLTMYWKVREILGYDDYYSYMMALEEERMRETTEAETASIEEYIAGQGWEVTSQSPSGVRVIVHEVGTGDNVASGQTITVNYSGFFLDGQLFDTSLEEIARENNQYMEGRPYAPYTLVIDQTSVITGWHEGFKELNEGSKATFIIPSALGYGERGNPPVIPGNTILRFDVELVDIE